MAAPTNVSAESTSITTATVHWDYSGSAGLSLYRSPDGITYSLVTAGILPTDTSYMDSGLSVATKYWYKLSDDLGSTFSSVVTVWTQTCAGASGDLAGISLPRFNGDAQQSDQLNDLAQRVEQIFGDRVIAPGECLLCVSDGQVIVDCNGGCTDFVVFADADINSISLNACDKNDINIEFVVPANTTRKICGFPAGFGFGGDECRKNPFVTGSTGGSISAGTSGGGGRASPSKSQGRNSYGAGAGGGGGGGTGSGCTCVPSGDGALTIKSCNSNNSLDCASGKSLKLLACGGRTPYTWSKTGSVSLSTTSGVSTTVTPPTNSGSGTGGVAYAKALCGVSEAHPHTGGSTYAQYGCNDAFSSCTSVAPGTITADTVGFASATETCGAHSGHVVTNCISTSVSCGTVFSAGAECATAQSKGAVNDTRTAPMIAAGCSPCGLNEGATVSVTDANGVVFTIILKA